MSGSRYAHSSGRFARGHPSNSSGASVYNKMAAGGPAGNTRMTFAGTCNARPVASLTVAVRADEGAIRAAEPAAMNVRRETGMDAVWRAGAPLVHAHHHVVVRIIAAIATHEHNPRLPLTIQSLKIPQKKIPQEGE
jgi:hypothetical protein